MAPSPPTEASRGAPPRPGPHSAHPPGHRPPQPHSTAPLQRVTRRGSRLYRNPAPVATSSAPQPHHTGAAPLLTAPSPEAAPLLTAPLFSSQPPFLLTAPTPGAPPLSSQPSDPGAAPHPGLPPCPRPRRSASPPRMLLPRRRPASGSDFKMAAGDSSARTRRSRRPPGFVVLPPGGRACAVPAVGARGGAQRSAVHGCGAVRCLQYGSLCPLPAPQRTTRRWLTHCHPGHYRADGRRRPMAAARPPGALPAARCPQHQSRGHGSSRAPPAAPRGPQRCTHLPRRSLVPQLRVTPLGWQRLLHRAQLLRPPARREQRGMLSPGLAPTNLAGTAPGAHPPAGRSVTAISAPAVPLRPRRLLQLGRQLLAPPCLSLGQRGGLLCLAAGQPGLLHSTRG